MSSETLNESVHNGNNPYFYYIAFAPMPHLKKKVNNDHVKVTIITG